MTIVTIYHWAFLIKALTVFFLILCHTRALFCEICLFSDGSNTVDLRKMETVSAVAKSDNTYKYNCAGIVGMSKIVICQQVARSESSCSIAVGVASTEKSEYSNGVLIISYNASSSEKSCPQDVRKGIINVVCGTETKFIVHSEDEPKCTYNFKLITNTCSSAGGMAISVGSLLIILFFLVIVIYLVSGILINHFVWDATGVQMIPNLEFWKDFPFLVWDGFLFIFRKCRKNNQTYDRI